ncbi:MAG: peptidoglycan DD-metalloendopeptidase family protein, partial [Bacteroidales bacterium]|nr:peptidoglycan DD-metalloendopeptidase family protein [Bacteroidales bacterium]
LIVVRHANGLETYYGHLSKILVETGESVNVGELIGLGGSTGRSTGPHLHFETRYKGFPFDPETIVVWDKNSLRNDTLVISRNKLNSTSRYSTSSSSGNAVDTGTGSWHTIKQGDTLSGIARKYGTSVSRICDLNDNLTPTTILSLGRKIRVK